MSDRDYPYFVGCFKELTGVDLSLYKEDQMKRRLQHFLNKKGVSSFNQLVSEMKRRPDLVRETLEYITINVTEFFRNPKHWDVLKETVIPSIPPRKRWTIWSAACSTGEEPYTLAMLLMRHYPELSFDILATDLDQKVLEQARTGLYRFAPWMKPDPDMLRSYFTALDHERYQLNKKVQQHVTFRQHNLLSDPYPSDVDLILCRNVMIYFTEEAKKGIYQRFSSSLKNGGVLFVGATEQILHPKDYQFKSLQSFFYQKN